MKLTGKAKEQFEKWTNSIKEFGYHFDRYDDFLQLPQSMQWGVYQDWADSLGYIIGAHSVGNGIFTWTSLNEGGRGSTRQEARNAAIEKLNELINRS